MLSIAQDLVYSINGGKKLTPKHVGLGSTVHQATRSKQLAQLFHSAGHVVSYDEILRLDTALAESTLQSMDTNGAVLPQNLVKGRFVYFSADNIDRNDCTSDGENSFHATQIAAWQRGTASTDLLKNIEPSHNSTISVPEAMKQILPVDMKEGNVTPQLKEMNANWFYESNGIPDCSLKTAAIDTAFMLTRQHEHTKSTWISFNQKYSTVESAKTTIGYMTIIQAPAHDIGTLNTIVHRIHQRSKLCLSSLCYPDNRPGALPSANGIEMENTTI